MPILNLTQLSYFGFMSDFAFFSLCYFILEFCLLITPVLSLYVIFLFHDSSLSYQECKPDIFFKKAWFVSQQLSKISFPLNPPQLLSHRFSYRPQHYMQQDGEIFGREINPLGSLLVVCVASEGPQK